MTAQQSLSQFPHFQHAYLQHITLQHVTGQQVWSSQPPLLSICFKDRQQEARQFSGSKDSLRP